MGSNPTTGANDTKVRLEVGYSIRGNQGSSSSTLRGRGVGVEIYMERWPRGLRQRFAKPSYLNRVPLVRIQYAPP